MSHCLGLDKTCSGSDDVGEGVDDRHIHNQSLSWLQKNNDRDEHAGAFRAIGFIHHIDQIAEWLLLDEEQFPQSPKVIEFWDRDVLLESLSARWRETRFGYIKNPDNSI
jgi:hypothetical protein